MARRKRTPVGDSPTMRAKVVYRITYPNVSRYSPLTITSAEPDRALSSSWGMASLPDWNRLGVLYSESKYML
jgi:hypothetical protein